MSAEKMSLWNPAEPHARMVLEALASTLPRRIIRGEAGPYLSRYTLAAGESGHAYLHQFHTSDSDLELHNHPWVAARSTILYGSYREERREGDGSLVARIYLPGDTVHVYADTFHRVDLLTDTVWTLFEVGERVQTWGFWNRETAAFRDWKEALRARGLEPGAP